MEDRNTQNSLKTDPSGDRLGDAAMDLENKLPTSGTETAPRPGVSLYSHYMMTNTGRQVFTDGLLDAIGDGVGVFFVARPTLPDVTVATGFGAHYPRAVSPTYGSITGVCPGTVTFTPPWVEINAAPFI